MIIYINIYINIINVLFIINLLRTAGRYIKQRQKGQQRIISIRNVNKEVTLMQI